MNVKLLFRKALLYSAVAFLTSNFSVNAQNPAVDADPKNDVMLQGFWWDSYQDPTVGAEGGLYAFLTNRADQFRAAGIDLVWTPPPSKGDGMAYFPTQLHNFNNAHGNETQLKAMLAKFKELGMHGMADVVVNHRSGSTGWSDFTNPAWGCEAIVANDEVKGVAGQVQPCGDNDEGEGFDGSRDMNHKSLTVQNGYKEYLKKLQALGFDSWRWDFTKGFPAGYVGEYNATTKPYYSVGELWDYDLGKLKGWIDGSGKSFTGTTTKSGTFDFNLFYTLEKAVNGAWYELANPGLKNQFGYAEYAVTFTQNHDAHDIVGEANIMKANAYILTHNGIPMVFLKHWLDYTQKMNELIAVRKQNGINAWSSVNVVTTNGMYAAYIDGKVAVKLGGGNWAPEGSGWIMNTSGTDYAVWSKIKIVAGDVVEAKDPDMGIVGPGISSWTEDVMMTSLGNGEYKLDAYEFAGGEVKFRANKLWAANWGGTTFPSGTGVSDGTKNITVPAGTYEVTFNFKTAAYSFKSTTPCICEAIDAPVCANGVKYANACKAKCAGITDYTDGECPVVIVDPNYAKIGIIGSATSANATTQWTTDVDMLTKDGINYTLTTTLLAGDAKFRQDDAWTINWGDIAFPSGTGTLDSKSNIPVAAGTYDITFNKTTAAYTFTLKGGDTGCVCTADVSPVCADGVQYDNACKATCAGKTNFTQGACQVVSVGDKIGIIGSATSSDTKVQWVTDIDMKSSDGINYTLTYTFLGGEAKFRQDDAWTKNWGNAAFPSGTGTQDGTNIAVTEGTYDVTFNKNTGAYNFTKNLSREDFNKNEEGVVVNVYPNPTATDWQVSSSEIIKSVKLIDALGKQVKSISVNDNSGSISGAGLSPGLYFAVITTAKSVQTIKLIKK